MGSGVSSSRAHSDMGDVMLPSLDDQAVVSDNHKKMLNLTWQNAIKGGRSSEVGQDIFVRILIDGRKIRQIFELDVVSDDKLQVCTSAN